MKKKILSALLIICSLTFLVSCKSKTGDEKSKKNDNSFNQSKDINVLSREDGSGTRGAFIELFGIEEKKDGKKIDNTTNKAVITNSTQVMISTVESDKYSIGYISLGSLNKTVKALKIDGIEATTENIKNGKYKIQRPFNIVIKDNLDEASKDFIDFIMSKDGQDIVEKYGYIKVTEEDKEYKGKAKGKIVVGGSSSVTPVMEKLKEEYVKRNKDVTVEVQQSDSTTGIISAIDGTYNIGMASRDLKDEEKGKVKSMEIAKDGIAVIVNKENSFNDVNTEVIKKIFTGEYSKWEKVK